MVAALHGQALCMPAPEVVNFPLITQAFTVFAGAASSIVLPFPGMLSNASAREKRGPVLSCQRLGIPSAEFMKVLTVAIITSILK